MTSVTTVISFGVFSSIRFDYKLTAKFSCHFSYVMPADNRFCTYTGDVMHW